MKVYGLIGNPLTHSFSKKYFTQKFLENNLQDYKYENFELEAITELPVLLREQPGLLGFNVTIPYKQAIVPFLAYQDEIVKDTGACNCVKIINGALHGFNTDVKGFQLSLSHFLRGEKPDALILGTGGASKAVEYSLGKMGLSYKVVSRIRSKGFLAYNDLSAEIMQRHLLIINTTPLGTFPKVEEAPAIPYELLTARHYLFDLVYNPPETSFLSRGAAAGAHVLNGYEMLVLQAEESWRIWNEA